jgi:hypothetical protein
VSKQVKDKVEEFPWEDKERVRVVYLPEWKRCFPKARTLNISGSGVRNLRGEFPPKHFQGMETILSLSIQRTNFRGDTFKFFPNLRRLECGENPFCFSYAGLDKLRSLTICGEAFNALIGDTTLPMLQELNIEAAFNFQVSSSQAEQGCEWMARLKKFRQEFVLESLRERIRRIKVIESPDKREWVRVLPQQLFKGLIK